MVIHKWSTYQDHNPPMKRTNSTVVRTFDICMYFCCKLPRISCILCFFISCVDLCVDCFPCVSSWLYNIVSQCRLPFITCMLLNFKLMVLLIHSFRHTMSGMNLVDLGNQPITKSEWRRGRRDSKDFTVATPTEFVKKFGGDYVINKVIITSHIHCDA